VRVLISRVLAPGLLICSFFMVACPASSRAAAQVNLFSDVVAVDGRDYEARIAAYKLALARVLVRVTGRRDIAAEPSLEPVFADANALVLRYQFLDEGRLEASFDGPAIERLMARMGFPVWGKERPTTLIWLAMDNSMGARTLVGGEQATEALRFLRGIAQERGIPIMFPLLDADDMAAVRFADVWGGFDDKVLQASRRYGADSVLIGRASRIQDGTWVARWTLHFAGQVYGFQGTIDDGLQLTADWYANQFSVVPQSGDSSVQMVVSDINSVSDYAAVRDYLERLSIVSEVYVSQASGDSIRFDLTLRGGTQLLRRAIGLNPNLIEDFQAEAGASGEGTLHFQFSP